MKKKTLFSLLGLTVVAGLCMLGSALVSQPKTVSAAASTVSVERYGATMISGDVKYAYDQLVTYVARKNPAATVPFDDSTKSVSETDLNLARDVFISDYPECFWYRGAGTYYGSSSKITKLEPDYIFAGATLTAAQDAVDAAAETILSGVPTGADVYETALYLHDAVAERIEYREVGQHQTVYGALVSGKAVCAGYAAAYQLLLQRSGIKAISVTGASRNIPHAWNAVWLDEDTCVYTDVTWDDQEDELYHYYFNLSRAEMEEDHVTNTGIFKLPSCNHTNESYFDKNGNVLKDTTTVAEATEWFEPKDETTRTAVLCDESAAGVREWLTNNGKRLYEDLGGVLSAEYGFTWETMGKEIHLTVTGKFIGNFYTVQFVTGDQIKLGTSGALRQFVKWGEKIEETSFTLTDSQEYYFPKSYLTFKNGLTVKWKSYAEIVVSGTPLANTTLTLEAPTRKQALPAPTVEFSLTSNTSGVLSGLEVGMEYRQSNTLTWTNVTEAGDVTFDDISDGFTLYVARRATDVTEKDGVKTFRVTKPDAPELTFVNPKGEDGTGSISTTEAHEYSTDGGKTWTDCGGELTGLSAGTYYVRTKWNGLQTSSKIRRIELTLEDGEEGLLSSCGISVAGAPLLGVLLLVGGAVLLKKRSRE